MNFGDLAPFIQRLLSAPNEATARRIMGAIGIGANSDSIIEGSTNLFYTAARAALKNAAILFRDEGVALGAAGTVDEIDFVGAGVTATRATNKLTVTIPGGGGGTTGVQVNGSYTDTNDATVTITSTIPVDGTKPEITEGDAFPALDTTHTPLDAANWLIVEVFFSMLATNTSADGIIIALFRDGATEAIGAAIVTTPDDTFFIQGRIKVRVLAGAVTPTLFEVRLGMQDAGWTGFINRSVSFVPPIFGDLPNASLEVREMLP